MQTQHVTQDPLENAVRKARLRLAPFLALMFALPMFLIADAAHSVRGLFDFTGWGFAIGGIILGYFAAAKYVPAARVALHEGRATRAVAEVQP